MKLPIAVISTEHARQLLVTIQWLRRDQKQLSRSVEAIVAHTNAVQVDSISVIARNHDLAFWNRGEDFRPEHLLTALYEKRTLLEQHYPLIIVPTSEYPFWHTLMVTRPKVDSPERLTLAPLIERARSIIAERGQVSSQDLPRQGRLPGGFNTMNAANKALETMWYDGELLIASRHSNRARIYSTPERLLPSELLEDSPSNDELLRFFAEKALRVLGLATFQSWSMLTNTYTGLWKTVPVEQRRTLLSLLVEEGLGVPIEVSGGHGQKAIYFLHADYLELLEQKTPHPVHVQLLAPLDMLLIDRSRLEQLFNFHYRFEAYTPKAKRTYGYYCMPILYSSRLVGRVDPVKNGNVLQLNLLQVEDLSLYHDATFLEELQRALTNLMLFANCSEIVSTANVGSRVEFVLRAAF
jgi:uncharacterized protein